MKRPTLNQIPMNLGGIIDQRGPIVTMSSGQWDNLLEVAYDRGWVLLELDDDEMPIKAYQRAADVDG